jgi:hypothetical protein
MADINRSIPHRRPAMSEAQKVKLDAYLLRVKPYGPQARSYMNSLGLSGDTIPAYTGRDEIAGVHCTGAPALVIYDADLAKVSLMVMVKDNDGNYEDVLFPSADLAGCFGRIGPKTATICVVENYAAGLAINRATGFAVAVAIFADNFAAVLSTLKHKYPESAFILCANNYPTAGGKSNLRQAAAAATANGALLATPTACTFAEQHKLEEDESISSRIEAAVDPSSIMVPTFQCPSGIPESPVPWPNAVHGAALMENLLAFLDRYIVMSNDGKIMLAMWVLFTHVFTFARVAPILALLSPVRRCGKTTVIQILIELVARPYPSSNVTPAVLFRTIAQWQPTMLMDEADTYLSNREHALTGIINSGHTPATAFVSRVEKSKSVRFNTYCPKMIAAIGGLPETISDRSIILPARRKRQDEHVEKFHPQSSGLIVTLRAQVVRWGADNGSKIASLQLATLASGNDRTDDNFEIILAIAHCLGGTWPERVKAAALALSVRHDESRASGVELLRDLKLVFVASGKPRLRTLDLIAGLCDDAEKPWLTYSKGKPITPREIASMLKPFGIESKNLCVGDARPKGYELDQFEDAFARYCDPD